MNVKYPEIKVKMVGEDGNAFAILGRVTKGAEKCSSAAGGEEEIPSRGNKNRLQ